MEVAPKLSPLEENFSSRGSPNFASILLQLLGSSTSAISFLYVTRSVRYFGVTNFLNDFNNIAVSETICKKNVKIFAPFCNGMNQRSGANKCPLRAGGSRIYNRGLIFRFAN